MTELSTNNLVVKADGHVLVDRATIRVAPGELAALLGPNGAGKTSLLRAAVGAEKIAGGTATIGGEESTMLSPMERARRLTYLPQTRPLAWPNLVRDVVALGRYAYGANLGKLVGQDAAAVRRAIEACGIAHLAARRIDTLSGGELARVHCARAFAAETPLLVADEPVASLDPRHQFRVMELIRDYVAQGGGALVVLHDISLAARYADRLIWMKEGRVVADGPPAETLTNEQLAAVFGVRASVSGRTVEMEGPI